MAEAKQAKPPQTQASEKPIKYIPFGESTEIQITPAMVRRYLSRPTKQGKQPTDADIINFMMLCRSRELNPFVGDAYLVGFDAKDGPEFNLITGVQALHKRAEINKAYEGLESGITVRHGDELQQRPGSLLLPGETLVGGWARCYRSDRKVPYYDEVALSVYNSGRSRWAKDPAGMIKKVAEAAVLRRAFPTQIGGLYTAEEMDVRSNISGPDDDAGRKSRMDQLTEQLRRSDEPQQQSGEEGVDYIDYDQSCGPVNGEVSETEALAAYESWKKKLARLTTEEPLRRTLADSYDDQRLTEEQRLLLESQVENALASAEA